MDMQNLSRRRFLLASGATVSLGALISACGGGGSKSGIARVGLAPDPAKLPTAEVTDVTLLRTATSLEYNAIFVYEAAKDAGYLSGDAAKLAARFQADHKEHAAATASLSMAAGTRPVMCPPRSSISNCRSRVAGDANRARDTSCTSL